MTGPPEAEDRQWLVASLAPERTLVRAWVASALLHAAMMVLFFVVGAVTPNNRITFDASQGVALMGRIGYAPPPEQPEEALEAEAPPPEVEPVEEPPPPEVAEVDDDEGDEPEPAEEELTDWDLIDRQLDPEAIAAVAEVTQREAERPRLNVQPLINRPPRIERPSETESEGSADAPADPAAQRPSVRYPEGTLNPVATDIGMWGPEGARSVLIIRNDRVRDSVHREAVETIFSTLPDWGDLRSTELDPIDDVDAMLIASTDLRYVARTFTAVLHHMEAEHVLRQIGRNYPGGVEWEERSGRIFGTPGRSNAADPRVFVIPTDGMFIFSRPEFLDPLMDGAPHPSGLADAITDASTEVEPVPTVAELVAASGVGPEPEAYDPGRRPCADRRGIGRRRCQARVDERRAASDRERTAWQDAYDAAVAAAEEEHERRLAARRAEVRIRGSRPDRRPPVRTNGWIRGLMEIGDFGGTGDDGPAVSWTFNGFTTFELEGQGSAPPPHTFHATMTLGRNPGFRGRLVFESDRDARAFRARVDDMIDANAAQLAAVGLLGALRDGTWDRDHNEVTLDTELGRSTLGRIATMLALSRAGR